MLDQVLSTSVSGNFFGTDAAVAGAGVLTCGDLFAGAGAFSLAASNVGIDVRFAVELDKHASSTYRSNLVGEIGPILYEQDILELAPTTVCAETVGHAELDLMLGGPPCQGFSVHRINGAGIDDPRNLLIHRYFQYVRHFRPRVFLMENVPGMLWPRHAKYLERFYQEAEAAGYKVFEPAALEAADFGVPQRRKRVFVLGVRSDLELEIDWPLEGPRCKDPNKEDSDKKWVPSGVVFETPVSLTDPNAVHMRHGPELVEVFKSTPANGGSRKDSNRILDCHDGHNGHKDVYGRIDPEKPGPTMTTACINPSKGRFVHPTEHHGITVRQAARFQTFPDDFEFDGGLIASGVQIGNAVPVLLGEAVIGHIAKALLHNQCDK